MCIYIYIHIHRDLCTVPIMPVLTESAGLPGGPAGADNQGREVAEGDGQQPAGSEAGAPPDTRRV